MIFSDFCNLLDEKRDICLFCIGPFGLEDGYIFLKSMMDPKKNIRYFCADALTDGVTIPSDLQSISADYLYAHVDEIVCVVMGLDKRGQVRQRLEQRGLKIYALNRDDMFAICNQITLIQDRRLTERLRSFWRDRKYRVQIETTSFCNARCVFCPNTSLKRRKNIMSDTVFAKIMERVKQEKLNVSTFILHLNGEPFTDPNLFGRIKQLKSEFPDSRIRFTTNFSLADEEVVEQILDSGLDEIVCSLNSVNAETYRKIMGLPYEKTIDNIENLLRRKETRNSSLDITLSIVATEDNAEEVEAFKSRWNGVKVRVMKLGQWVDKEVPQNVYNHSREGVCPAPYTTIHILSNGDYAFCSFDAEGIVGCNVMDTSIKDAWTAKIFREARQWHLKHGRTNKECANCSF